MKTKLLSLIFILLLGNMAMGQGAPTPELAWDNRPSNGGNGNQYDYWFEMETDINSAGNGWDPKDANSIVLPFNTDTWDTTITASTSASHLQGSYDESVFTASFESGYMIDLVEGFSVGNGYEEWFVFRVPSTGNLLIEFDVDFLENSSEDRDLTTIQWYDINGFGDLDTISRYDDQLIRGVKDSRDITANGNPLTFNISSSASAPDNINGNFVLLRIGNNDLYGDGSLISKYKLTIYTNNNICKNALDFPRNTVTPFSSTTDDTVKELLDAEDEVDATGATDAATVYGSDGIVTPSGTPATVPGEWFKITTQEDQLSFAACGTGFDAQIIVLDACPDDGGLIIGKENDNVLDDGSDADGHTHWCKNPVDTTTNSSTNPIIQVKTNVSPPLPSIFYAYIFGDTTNATDGDRGDFNFFILDNESGILPVEWLDFSGFPLGFSNRLDWSTATETQNDYFSLEKSADGINYESLAQIQGQGDAIFQNDYSILDENPYYQTYYRISQVDFDGTVNNGPQTVVINDSKKVFIHLLSNPVSNNEIKLRYRSDREQEVIFYLTGLDGKRIRNQTVIFIEGSSDLSIAIPSLAPGLYLLSATANNEQWTEKVVVR